VTLLALAGLRRAGSGPPGFGWRGLSPSRACARGPRSALSGSRRVCCGGGGLRGWSPLGLFPCVVWFPPRVLRRGWGSGGSCRCSPCGGWFAGCGAWRGYPRCGGVGGNLWGGSVWFLFGAWSCVLGFRIVLLGVGVFFIWGVFLVFYGTRSLGWVFWWVLCACGGFVSLWGVVWGYFGKSMVSSLWQRLHHSRSTSLCSCRCFPSRAWKVIEEYLDKPKAEPPN
jgi:hypothetical protein